MEVPPAEELQRVKDRLEKRILDEEHGHVGVGITGGAMLFRWLRQEGRDDLRYTMASQTDYPGWGFMRMNDATTIWEAWELKRPGHSLCHSSFLFIGSWYIDSVLGIRSDPNTPGYKKIVIHPPKSGDTPLEWARGYFNGPTGKISVDWQKQRRNSSFYMKVTVPVNTTATVYVPSDGPVTATAGALLLRDRKVPGSTVYEVPSGEYEFKSRITQPQQ